MKGATSSVEFVLYKQEVSVELRLNRQTECVYIYDQSQGRKLKPTELSVLSLAVAHSDKFQSQACM